MRLIDEIAKQKISIDGLPPDLHIPIAARNIDAILKYIGTIDEISSKAIIVSPYIFPIVKSRMPIWKASGVEILHYPKQVWVHVNYSGYRKAYEKVFPEQDITNLVVDHIMNRRVARLKGFEYLRVTAISRGANSVSGNVTEKSAFAFHSTPNIKQMDSQNQAFIQYADIADILKMLDIKTGGKIQEGINEYLYYFFEEEIDR